MSVRANAHHLGSLLRSSRELILMLCFHRASAACAAFCLLRMKLSSKYNDTKLGISLLLFVDYFTL